MGASGYGDLGNRSIPENHLLFNYSDVWESISESQPGKTSTLLQKHILRQSVLACVCVHVCLILCTYFFVRLHMWEAMVCAHMWTSEEFTIEPCLEVIRDFDTYCSGNISEQCVSFFDVREAEEIIEMPLALIEFK